MSVDKENFREQIVIKASAIFARFGFRKTTMDEIAREMHKGKSSIYYYFQSKEEIFQAVVDREAAVLKAEFEKGLGSSDDPKEQLKAYVTIRMKAFIRLSNYYEALKSEYLGHLDFIDSIRKKYDENEIRRIEGILQNGVNQGVFHIEHTNLVAIALFTAIKGLEIPMFWSLDEYDFDQHIDNLLSVLFYGIVGK